MKDESCFSVIFFTIILILFMIFLCFFAEDTTIDDNCDNDIPHILVKHKGTTMFLYKTVGTIEFGTAKDCRERWEFATTGYWNYESR